MTSSLQNSEGKSKFRYIQPTPHPPFSRSSPTIVKPFRRLTRTTASWSSLASNWTLIGRTFRFYLCWWVLAFSWCNLWFSIQDELLLFKWRRFLLNSSPGVCTVYDLVAVSSTTSPDSSRSVTHTYSPGDKTGNSLAPQWVSWFTFCLHFSFLSLAATSEKSGVLG